MKKIIAIRNIIRAIGVSSILIFALVAGAGFARASVDIGGGNDTTGPNSENENSWDIDHEVEFEIENDVMVDNENCFEVDTGNNSVSDNTEVEDISTGDIWGEIVVENDFGGDDIELMSFDPFDVDVDLENDTTGPNSENINDFDLDISHDIDISNNADIDNNLNLWANTGNNEVEHNTIVGDVDTGDVRFDIETKNIANSSMGSIDLGDINEFSVSGDLKNELTGPCSSNKNEVEIDSDFNLDISNDVEIDNNTRINVNTGNNEIEDNTIVGDVSTGGVRIDSTTINMAN